MQRAANGVWAVAVGNCAKSMRHGPCAGVGPGGDCEVPGAGRCSFVDIAADAWPYARVPTVVPVLPGATHPPHLRPVIVADLPAAAVSADSVRAAAATLAGTVDAALIGDNGLARVQFPPSYRARLLADAGLPAWVGLNCRDRNRVALEGEIAASLDVGVAGLHCVTGDHPARDGSAPDGRPDTQAVFDLDSLGLVRLVRLAAQRGVAVSVAHAPAAPPTAVRLPRVLAKVAAGADTVFVDHCGGPAEVARAVADLRAAGFDGAVIACVPVLFDAESAQVLLSFAAGLVPPGYVESVLDADDPEAAGVAAAVALCAQMLAIPGVDGVNLSGGSRAGREPAAAAALAEIGLAVHALSAAGARS